LSDKNETIKSNPHDGLLDVFIKTGKKNESFLKTKTIKIFNAKHKLIIDNIIEIETPTELSVMKNKINAIVGKNRMFE